MLLVAALNDFVGIFDMSKILQRVPPYGNHAPAMG